jgi:hypothetical protein
MPRGLGGRYGLGSLSRCTDLRVLRGRTSRRRLSRRGDGIGGDGGCVLSALNQVSNAKELRKLFLDPA